MNKNAKRKSKPTGTSSPVKLFIWVYIRCGSLHKQRNSLVICFVSSTRYIGREMAKIRKDDKLCGHCDILQRQFRTLGFNLTTVTPVADLTGGHTCSGRRGPNTIGHWRPQSCSLVACRPIILVKQIYCSDFFL